MSKTEIKITTENDDKTKNCEEPFNFLDFPNDVPFILHDFYHFLFYLFSVEKSTFLAFSN